MGAKGKPKTPGSGRKKGVGNKNSIPLIEKANELGVDPFEILLLFAKGDWKRLGYESKTKTLYSVSGDPYEIDVITADLRLKAAAEAAQYLYPKRKSVDSDGNSNEQNISVRHIASWNKELK